MTRTTQVEWHPDRPFVHFGSPPEVTYWRNDPKPPKKKKKPKVKEPKTYYPGRGESGSKEVPNKQSEKR